MRASAGTVTTIGGSRAVVLDDGTRLTPLWPASVVLVDGDAVQVVLVDGVAHVIGPVVATPRPISGSIAGAASSGLVPVSTAAGTVRARYAGTVPAIGTLVGLIWQGGGAPPFLLPGTLAPIASDPQPPPPTPAPPPTGPASGTLQVPALGSGTWLAGGTGWLPTTDLRQGGAPFANRESSGGWWYGAAAQVLHGRAIPKASIRLPARTRIGYYNNPQVVHLYLTSNPTRPAGDLGRVAGPFDVTLPPGWAPAPDQGWIQLPAGWGQSMVDTGAGIAIFGGPYLGLAGIGTDPASGLIALDWTR